MADRDPNSSDEELDPSVLGTIDHWKKEYAESIERFEDHGDIGEVWFGKDCMKRIVKWMSNSEMVSKSDDIIDLGCGNAALLIDLVSDIIDLGCGETRIHKSDWSRLF
uniref:Protein-lysine N-methyltransferase mettl10 n=1 Tax=Cacopsylla melanoneura TaxID=428564 RepID=A0A8D8Z2K7_9HEMI